MKYMLDTNICIYAIKNNPPQVREFLQALNPEDVCVSAITYAELMHGVNRSSRAAWNYVNLARFMCNFTILDYTPFAAEESGAIIAMLRKQGTPIGPMDSLIAGHAKAEDLTLVTNNIKEFARIPGLKLENWA